MAEFINIEETSVAPNQNVNLIARKSCTNGNILHSEGSGIITLCGILNNPCGSFARHQVFNQANVAIPYGDIAATPIDLVLQYKVK
jgi:hypothetical protein